MADVDALADLMLLTQRELGKMKYTDLYTSLTDYPAMRRIMKQGRQDFKSGTRIQFNAVVSNSGNAHNTGLFATDATNIADNFIQGSIPWRHSTTSYAIEEREVKINSEPAQIVDLVKARRQEALVSFAELAEANFWGKPATSADVLTPFGIEYWIVPSETASPGFNGGNPTGFTEGCAGISSTTYPNWANWVGKYANVTASDFLKKAREALKKTNFMPPVEKNDYNTGDKYEFYTNWSVYEDLVTLMETRNDNLGKDILGNFSEPTFRGTSIMYVPSLDAKANAPFYGVNWGEFKTTFLKGEFMRETPPTKVPDKHRTVQTFIDWSYNWNCRNRRRQFILHT